MKATSSGSYYKQFTSIFLFLEMLEYDLKKD